MAISLRHDAELILINAAG